MSSSEDKALAALNARGKSTVQPAAAGRKKAANKWLIGGLIFAGLVAAGIASVETAPDAPSAAATASSAPAPTLAQETTKVLAEAKDYASFCDQAAADIDKNLNGNGSAQELYEAATEASQLCDAAASNVYNLPPPTRAFGDLKDAFRTALADCGLAYDRRHKAYDAMAKAIDSNFQPSRVQASRKTLSEANGMMEACQSGLDALAGRVGVQPAASGEG